MCYIGLQPNLIRIKGYYLESLLQLIATDNAIMRILQITDSHLFEQVSGTLLGINTYQSYQAVIQVIEQQARHYDLIVATGDLAQDNTIRAYQHFAQGVARLSTPCVWLPGNHDFQPAMVDAFTDNNMMHSKQVLLGDHWYIILLDSQVIDSAYGELSEYQLDWLDKKLAQYSQRHALVLLHHHPIASGCHWLDQHRLRNSHMFDEVLAHHPQAATLLCGHIHQELDLQWNGRRVLSTPSTCVQFKPHSTRFALDFQAPGWRELELFPDGSIQTTVQRLVGNKFRPDMDSEGY